MRLKKYILRGVFLPYFNQYGKYWAWWKGLENTKYIGTQRSKFTIFFLKWSLHVCVLVYLRRYAEARSRDFGSLGAAWMNDLWARCKASSSCSATSGLSWHLSPWIPLRFGAESEVQVNWWLCDPYGPQGRHSQGEPVPSHPAKSSWRWVSCTYNDKLPKHMFLSAESFRIRRPLKPNCRTW